MSERDIGKLIATQDSMKEQLDKLETSVSSLHDQQELLLRRLSIGKGIAIGITAASGTVGSVITLFLTNFTGGS